MIQANAFVALVWSYTFYFFLIFVFLSLFMAVFMISFENTVNNHGYPSDFGEQSKWNYTEYMYWLLQ